MLHRLSLRWFVCALFIGLMGCSLIDPVGTAIKKLQDPSAAVRRKAIQALSLKPDARAVEPLILCLNDQDMEVRNGAANLLGSLNDPRAIEPLIASLPPGDEDFRKVVTAALDKLDHERAGQRLMFFLQKKGSADATKVALIEALGGLRYQPAVDILISYSTDKNEDVSRSAIEALGRIGAPAVPPLLARLKDPKAQIRAAAAEALGRIGDTRAIGPLLACLKNPAPEATAEDTPKETTDDKPNEEQPASSAEDNLLVRQKASEALGKLGPTAVKPLIACLQEKDSTTRKLAAAALGQLKDGRALKPLLACMVELAVKNPDEENPEEGASLQQSVFDALANLGQPAVEPLVAYLHDKDVHVRQDAAEVLSRLHYLPNDNDGKAAFFILRKSWDELLKLGPPAIGPLLETLKDENSEMRKGAAETLGQLGDKRAVEPLITSLQDDSSEVKKNAVKALGQLGDKRAVEPLIGTFKNEFDEVKMAAAEALGVLGDNSALMPLLDGLKDEHADLRQACAQALEKLHYQPEKVEDNITYLIAAQSWDKVAKIGPAAFDPLVACLPDTAIRDEVIEALGKLGDKRAIEPLSHALPDWNFNATLVTALEQLDWKPASDEEQVYVWIAKKDSDQLKVQWEKAKRVLLADISSGDRKKMENAVHSFMAIGDPKVIDDMVSVIEYEGDKDLAEMYLNCGNDRLAEAARDWASKNGYQTIMLPAGSHGMHWGSW